MTRSSALGTCFDIYFSIIVDHGGDGDRYALYSSFSPGFQKYLEGLYAVHSAVAQADGARASGTHVRRKEIETIHPIVRVHPVTGWKAIYVNPGTSSFSDSQLDK